METYFGKSFGGASPLTVAEYLCFRMKSIPGEPESIYARQDIAFGITYDTISCFKVEFQNNSFTSQHVFQW